MTSILAPFEAIPIDKTEIPQCDLDIQNKVRSNLFSWNGQFSPQFIETLLNTYAHDGDNVIDPFAGSGTTLCEAARKGLSGYGMELNVSAYFMAKTYELINRTHLERQALVSDIVRILAVAVGSGKIIPTITDAINRNKGSDAANALSALVIMMDLFNNEPTDCCLRKKWEGLKKIILELPFSSAPVKVDMGDARRLNCPDDFAALLITSPPYINVFNYHQKYRRSVEALGYNVLAIAKNEFGSNRKNRSNRLLTVIQYCIDMALSIKEAIRSCKSGSRMIYVVGRESCVLGYSFCNSRLIFEIATEIFALPFCLRQERVFKNRFGQLIYEDILHFENSKGGLPPSNDSVVSAARDIAVRTLLETAEMHPDSGNIALVFDAIQKAQKVNMSGV